MPNTAPDRMEMIITDEAGIRLLRARSAPLVIAFLYSVFRKDSVQRVLQERVGLCSAAIHRRVPMHQKVRQAIVRGFHIPCVCVPLDFRCVGFFPSNALPVITCHLGG